MTEDMYCNSRVIKHSPTLTTVQCNTQFCVLELLFLVISFSTFVPVQIHTQNHTQAHWIHLTLLQIIMLYTICKHMLLMMTPTVT